MFPHQDPLVALLLQRLGHPAYQPLGAVPQWPGVPGPIRSAAHSVYDWATARENPFLGQPIPNRIPRPSPPPLWVPRHPRSGR